VSFFLTSPFVLVSFTVSATARPCWNALKQQGSLEILPSGGVPPYFISVNSQIFTQATTFDNVPAGVVTIVIRDSASSPAVLSDTFQLENYRPVSASFSVWPSLQVKVRYEALLRSNPPLTRRWGFFLFFVFCFLFFSSLVELDTFRSSTSMERALSHTHSQALCLFRLSMVIFETLQPVPTSFRSLTPTIA
jgi:hypothetical protein